ncbi:MAG: SDR family oxidoreductase [Peptococcaceae bacterium]|jgi:NAD(P)-dependent dehydrogenase (short-subunit alcohol dehydrogenase family)|nr:SDR family oxidoreductase [Peptococcaceae bacterium]
MKLPFKPDFNGKVAVVTGGGGVLCAMFAKALAACGAKVAVLDLNEEAARGVADEIAAAGGVAMAGKVNVLEKDSVAAIHSAVLAAYGKCDILINGAGGNNPRATTDDEFFDRAAPEAGQQKSFFDLDPAGFDFVFGLNMKGTLLPTQAFALDMVEKNSGAILNISSMNAFTPLTKIPAYSAAKAAVSNFTQWLAVYFAKTGIRVNALAPGFFSTAQNAKLLWNDDGTPTARTGKILRNTPMERFGEPEELIGGMLFLLDSGASSFVTGVVLPIDGGFAAYSGV